MEFAENDQEKVYYYINISLIFKFITFLLLKFIKKEEIEEDLEEGVQMVRDLQDLKQSLNQKIKEDESFQLFENMDLNLE